MFGVRRECLRQCETTPEDEDPLCLWVEVVGAMPLCPRNGSRTTGSSARCSGDRSPAPPALAVVAVVVVVVLGSVVVRLFDLIVLPVWLPASRTQPVPPVQTRTFVDTGELRRKNDGRRWCCWWWCGGI